MIRFEYDPQFVEQATFLSARRDAEKECMLHETLDNLYRIEDAELRQRLFRDGYFGLFRRFGLDRIVPAHVRDFRLITTRLERCIIREADRARAQSVDLYREKSLGQSDRAGPVMIMAVCPQLLLEPVRLSPWLNRQLQHVEDMLDDRFAYEPALPDLPALRESVVRDRYAVIWDIHIEGRLIRSGKVIDDQMERLWSVFRKAFSCEAVSTARAAFEKLAAGGSLTHPQILAWAAEPGRLFRGEEKNVRSEIEVCTMA